MADDDNTKILSANDPVRKSDESDDVTEVLSHSALDSNTTEDDPTVILPNSSTDNEDVTQVLGAGGNAGFGDETVIISQHADDATEILGADDATVVIGSDDATVITEAMPAENQTGAAGGTTGYTGSTKMNISGAKALGSAQGGVIKDRFVLEARLGKGGMGQVFRAVDLRKQEAQDDNPRVAIKFLGEEFAKHPRALISLQREAKKTQQLAHPNILTVYDFDREGDRVYMTMELLDGAPLGDWEGIEFKEGKKPSVELLIQEMATGLAYAHKQGFVHSDFKPDNVFVTEDGRLKILDFGIARMMEEAAVEADSFDAGELGALTVRYASLEMLEGNNKPHPSDDVYALGLMAYQLYAGKHPYEGKSAQKALDAEMVPEPIKGLKRHQWRAILGALQLTRDKRTKTAEEFLKAFNGTQQRNQALIAMVGVLVLVSAYLWYQARLAAGPAIPFEELPIATQEVIINDVEMGHKSIDAGDWDGASRYFMNAYDLHPRNPEAELGLERVRDMVIERAAGMTNLRQKEYLLKLVNAYSEHEFFANDEQMRALREQLRTELD
jgi:predicted Ser/Thr protein kinase